MELVEQSNYNNQAKAKSLELFWSKHIQLKQESGLSGAAYCRQHELSCHQLYYWKSKLKLQSDEATPFIAIKLQPRESNHTLSPEPVRTLCSLELINGLQLKIHDQAVLPILISLLSQ